MGVGFKVVMETVDFMEGMVAVDFKVVMMEEVGSMVEMVEVVTRVVMMEEVGFMGVMVVVGFMGVMVGFKVVIVKMDLMLGIVAMMGLMVEDQMHMMDLTQGFMVEAVNSGDLDKMNGQRVGVLMVMMILVVVFMDLMVVEVEEIGIDFF